MYIYIYIYIYTFIYIYIHMNTYIYIYIGLETLDRPHVSMSAVSSPGGKSTHLPHFFYIRASLLKNHWLSLQMKGKSEACC